MALSRREIAKDVTQQSVEAALATAGHVATIFFDAARRITSELARRTRTTQISRP
jgi:hypothetical protein